MKLSSLHIERFGARSNLQLDQLSDHLNVVYGPNGSGKSTVARFIGWILHGSDVEDSRRYLSVSQHRAGGTLTILDGHRRSRTVARYYEAGREQLRVTEDGREAYGFDAGRLTGISVDEYRTIFSFGFDSPPELGQLLSAANRGEFTLSHSEADVRRLRELTARLETLRREYNSLAGHETVAALAERRQQLHAELESIEHRRAERLRQIQVECDRVAATLSERRNQVSELESLLQRTEANINTRRQQLDQAAELAHQTRQKWMEERRQEVADIDYQIQQWHQVLDSIRQRNESLRDRLAQTAPQTAVGPSTDEHELKAFLRSLGYRIDDIEHDLHDLVADDLGQYHASGVDGEVAKTDYLRSILGAALSSMRDDVSRLARELQRQQTNAKLSHLSREQDHLKHCESELTSLIDSLNQRRQTLVEDPEYASIDWARLNYWTSADGYHDTRYVWPATRGTQVNGTWINGSYVDGNRSPADVPGRPLPTDPIVADANGSGYVPGYTTPAYTSYPYPAYGDVPGVFEASGAAPAPPQPTGATPYHRGELAGRYTITDPVLEARLGHLHRRREYLLRRLSELNSEVTTLEHQLESLQNSRDAIDESRRAEAIRQELATIETRIRQAEEREARRREIETLERQVEELQRGLGPSEVLREAAAMLARFTGRAYRAIRITDRREVWIENDHGQSVGYQELSRGTRDQLYLSLALAIVAAYRRRGIEMPLVLNDPFVNIDADRAIAVAEVLAHFASTGHQVVLFTRHEHVMNHFASLHAKIYTLRERNRYVEPRPLPPARDLYLDQAPPVATPTPHIAPPPTTRPVRHEVTQDWVAQWESTPPRPVVRPRIERNVVPETATVTTPAEVLAEHSPLGEVTWLNRQHVARLADHGIRTVYQFLEMEPEEGERLLAVFSVTAPLVFRWQSELSLQCYVGIAASDAALLVACGVDDPQELSYIEVDELHQRIERFLLDGSSRSQYGSIARFERSRLERWIQRARESRYQRRAQRWDRYRNGSPRSETVERFEPRVTARSTRRRTRAEAPRTEPTKEKARFETKSTEVEETAKITRLPSTEKQADETLRFYLEPSDPVVDAPSIGPKTAERFHAIGVTTVAELLTLDPKEAAERINYRRISEELIRTWQLQTRLVCRVPNLRGHDAQILVACDVPDAGQLSKMDAEALYAQVRKFCRSAEGKRIIRSSKAPDLEEVTSWIRWAQSARALVSA